MMTVSNLSAGHAASGYYQSEGYYMDGASEADRSTEFYGQGAKEAGLSEQIDNDQFAALLDGQAPDGRLMGRIRDGEREHRPGIDLTFSAPKGVSIAALVLEDSRVVSAHNEAVKATLDYAEQHVVRYRQVEGGEVVEKTGGKIIVGLFQHDTSRALDPQLHTHAVIANMVKGEDGEYRALHNDQIYRSKMVLGQVYRNELAQRLQALGYETEAKDKGLFDITAIHKDLVDGFSKRREEILSSLESRGLEANAKNSALATLSTRSAKEPINRAELRDAWRDEAAQLGYNTKHLLQDMRAQEQGVTLGKEETTALAQRAVDFAVTHLAERHSIYSRNLLVDTALKFDGKVSAQAVEAEVKLLVQDKVLFPLMQDKEVHFTDVENVRLERENIRRMNVGRDREVLDMRTAYDKVTARTSDGVLSKHLSKSEILTDGQKEAVTVALSEKGRVVGVQGLAGTGKTYMLDTVRRLADTKGYAMEGLAPSHKAVAALNEALPGSATLESALVKHENGRRGGDKSRTILVVDEAGMLSSKDMNRVLTMAHTQGYGRLVLVGDIKQHDAVGAGSAFRALQEAGMKTAHMTDIQRQRDHLGRGMVADAVAGRINAAMEAVTQVSSLGADGAASERRVVVAEKIASDWLARNAEGRRETGIVTLTNELRQTVNARIQDGLRAEGQLKGEGVELRGLTSMNFTWAETRDAGSYKPGDIVVAMVAKSNSRLVAGAQYRVRAVDADARAVTVEARDGKVIELDLSSAGHRAEKLAVYHETRQTFFAGDTVKFRITDAERGIKNATEARVSLVSEDRVVIETQDRQRVSLATDTLAAQGMQLAYAATGHDFQGTTVKDVILGMVSNEKLANQKSFYVGVSRMKDSVHLVTDDVDKLTARLERDTGERVDALQALREGAFADKSKTENEPQNRSENETERASERGAENRGQPAENERSKQPQNEPGREVKSTPENDPIKALEELHERQGDLFRQLAEISKDQKVRGERER